MALAFVPDDVTGKHSKYSCLRGGDESNETTSITNRIIKAIILGKKKKKNYLSPDLNVRTSHSALYREKCCSKK
jgi:hypothetical protein